MTGYLFVPRRNGFPMSRPLNPEVRFRLLWAGYDVVLDQGFHGCGVQNITAAASVPKGSFYNYFESKEAFAAEILDAYWQNIEDRYTRLLRDAETAQLERIACFFRAISDDHAITDFRHGCLIGNLALELSSTSEKARVRLKGILDRWEEFLATCLREAQKRGDLARRWDVKQLTSIIIEAYEGAVMRLPQKN
ncbi:TetR/AcrR family transcriptional regulator [Paraburkholderia caribensis]|uniref:TetR/AcrR family transcriptional regulator n=1 Tax=Paraburkholderia caribensis TaxID=75105 RepID=UPI001CAC7E76|nr:TetR/AcrR family transcriptional regulator [Paraburkholderia caribensis]CAG9249471.1 Transcriptional regulator, TetR family [Paraburkholderia caribensis]